MSLEPKTIHLVGAQETNYPWGVENRMIKAFQALGHRIISTDFRKNRSRLPELLQQPCDLVLVCRGEGIRPELIQSLPWPTVLWYAEHLGTLERSDPQADDRRRELAFNCSAFDYVFVVDANSVEVARRLGASRPGWLSCVAVDPEVNKKLDLPRLHDVTFVGSNTGRRQVFLEEIRKHFNVHSPSIWDVDELNALYNQSRIVLNIHSFNLKSVEARLAEVLGSGAFMLTEELSMKDFLVDGEHLAAFRQDDPADCLEKLAYWLKHDREREAVARQGHEYVHQRHTYQYRMTELLEQIDFEIKKSSWPSHALGVLFDSQGRPTAHLPAFYQAVSERLNNPSREDDKSVMSGNETQAPSPGNGHRAARIQSLLNGAREYASKGELRAAIESYETAIKLAPLAAALYGELGVLLASNGRLDPAEFFFLKACWLEPGLVEALFNLGILYVKQQRHEEAVEAMRKCLAQAPGFKPALDMLDRLSPQPAGGDREVPATAAGAGL